MQESVRRRLPPCASMRPCGMRAQVFRLDYMGRPGCLAQSPQFYKQMAVVSDMPRVFEIGPVFRCALLARARVQSWGHVSCSSTISLSHLPRHRCCCAQLQPLLCRMCPLRLVWFLVLASGFEEGLERVGKREREQACMVR